MAVNRIPICGQNLYDIDIGLKHTTVTSKLSLENTSNFPVIQVFKTPVEAYGAKNCKTDFYHQGMHLEELRKNIKNSEESEVFFTFLHNKETKP